LFEGGDFLAKLGDFGEEGMEIHFCLRSEFLGGKGGVFVKKRLEGRGT
jgi:hypothetical protein